jgi:DNA replication protein DnaC
MQDPSQAETVQANPTTDPRSGLPGDTGDGPQPIGKLLNGFERFLPPQQTAEEIAEEDRCRKAELERRKQWKIAQDISRLVDSAGRRFEHATLDSYRSAMPAQREVVSRLKSYLDNESARGGQGLVFFGPVGTGKDHLAFAVCRELIRLGCPSVEWMNVQRWFSYLRDRMDDDDKSEASELRRLSEPRLLVLSELVPPFGPIGQHMATLLYLVVEERTAYGFPTIATLNVADDAEAIERIGRPTWDRLCDNAGKLFCNWPSYRAPAWKVNC